MQMGLKEELTKLTFQKVAKDLKIHILRQKDFQEIKEMIKNRPEERKIIKKKMDLRISSSEWKYYIIIAISQTCGFSTL